MALDIGAKRLGFAVVSSDSPESYQVNASGVLGLERGEDEKYQQYRRRLIEHWVELTPSLLAEYSPDEVVMETLPAMGSGNFIEAGQSELCKAVGITIIVMSRLRGYTVREIAATSWQTKLCGPKPKTKKKRSKVDIRNGVTRVLPDFLEGRKWLEDVFADEVDAVGIGLVALGYGRPKDD